jgi:hypothetical protein
LTTKFKQNKQTLPNQSSLQPAVKFEAFKLVRVQELVSEPQLRLWIGCLRRANASRANASRANAGHANAGRANAGRALSVEGRFFNKETQVFRQKGL